MPVAKRSLLFLLLLASAACGFHLRGQLSLPPEMQATYIDYRGSDLDVRRVLGRALSENGITVVRSRAEATAVLRVLRSTVEQEVLSKNIDGRPEEYRVTVVLEVVLQTPEGRRSGEPVRMEKQTVLNLDPNDPLGARVAREAAAEGLRETAARQVLERLGAKQAMLDSGKPAELGNETVSR